MTPQSPQVPGEAVCDHVWQKQKYQDGAGGKYWRCFGCGARTHDKPTTPVEPDEAALGEVETLARVIAEQSPNNDGFVGAHAWDDYEDAEQELIRTLARGILAAGYVPSAAVTKARAQAWDEGATKASPHGGGYLRSLLIENPYRAALAAKESDR